MKYDKNFVLNMKKAGKLAAKVLNEVVRHAKKGVTTNELDQIAYEHTLSLGAEAACLGYKGYPKTICTSINDILCHGVPDDTKLKDGDIINIDVTIRLPSGHHGDTSITVYIDGEEADSDKTQKLELISLAKQARDAGIAAVRPKGTVGDIGFMTYNAINKYKGKYAAAADIGGHGIGKKFHDHPFVPPTGTWGDGFILRPWTCITVEPIVVDGNPAYSSHKIENSEIVLFKTLSGKNACQFEHTVLVTDVGYEILTLE
jgi:methionyl aminopeptidase